MTAEVKSETLAVSTREWPDKWPTAGREQLLSSVPLHRNTKEKRNFLTCRRNAWLMTGDIITPPAHVPGGGISRVWGPGRGYHHRCRSIQSSSLPLNRWRAMSRCPSCSTAAPRVARVLGGPRTAGRGRAGQRRTRRDDRRARQGLEGRGVPAVAEWAATRGASGARVGARSRPGAARRWAAARPLNARGRACVKRAA